METPKLCKKHFYQVAGYFDKDVAFEFEVDGEGCLICNKTLFIESARRYVEQNKHLVHDHSGVRASAE